LPDAHVLFNVPILFHFIGENWNKNGTKTATSFWMKCLSLLDHCLDEFTYEVRIKKSAGKGFEPQDISYK